MANDEARASNDACEPVTYVVVLAGERDERASSTGESSVLPRLLESVMRALAARADAAE